MITISPTTKRIIRICRMPEERPQLPMLLTAESNWDFKVTPPGRWLGGAPCFANGLVPPVTAKSTPRATAAAFFSWPGLVNGERSPFEFLTVQGSDCRLYFLIAAHFDKAETFRAARITVHDD